ncbi:D-alanyl-D-alanine carboxypeptidase DacF precursor [Kiritimatiella glycovorans]|uniref:D-alanyl-D-alanine carboxypeptidase DacF n=2 Tax=Kiritimatiella glycovorans TaxID=1307763 RepID=A0A0G3EH34_9BACT|nr:D-alanyl-D-alanine carboxypeptidase DacF precursor [Kiritimatiella glycovorans]
MLAGAAALALSMPGAVRAVRRCVLDPCLGAVLMDAADGALLYEKRARLRGRPASLTKMMTLLVVLEAVRRGEASLEDEVAVTAEAAGIGGSQVYLAEGERFRLDDMLYALMVKSANDVARALALHFASTREAFVARMNARAGELGLAGTEFHTEHGLPPGRGQEPDVSTALDMARLARELVKHPDTLRYTSTEARGFRNGEFMLRSHNPLLGSYEGCDGLKTGYTWIAGWSIAATAERDGRRLIAVVLGSPRRETRNREARRLLDLGFGA